MEMLKNQTEKKNFINDTESAEQRASRLEHVNALQKKRLERESSEERALRLQQMRVFQQKREAVQNMVQSDDDSTAPLLQQTFARTRMMKFHEELSSIDFNICSVCLETFSGAKMTKSTICQRCCRDKKDPKLYSTNNNMDPGEVPIELQVSTQ